MLLLAGGLMLTACATTSATQTASEPSSEPTVSASSGPVVPAQVDVHRWDGLLRGSVFFAESVGPFDLSGAIEQSDLVVVARVADQGPFPDHDVFATESTLSILKVLEGEHPGAEPRLYTMGTPVYLEGHYDIDGIANPPLFDETYVFFLRRYPEVPNANSDLVPVDDVWIALGHGAYLQGSDGVLRWNGDGDFPPLTLEELRVALQD